MYLGFFHNVMVPFLSWMPPPPPPRPTSAEKLNLPQFSFYFDESSELINKLNMANTIILCDHYRLNTWCCIVTDKPLSLEVLLNNTELGKLLTPLLRDPAWLDDLLHASVKPDKVNKTPSCPYLLWRSSGTGSSKCGTLPSFFSFWHDQF